MEAYNYTTPPGYGDTFYVYAFDVDVSGANLPAGSNAFNQRQNITNGDFVLRWFKGIDPLGNAAEQIQIRDWLQTPFFSNPISPGLLAPNIMANFMGTGWAVMPEKVYPSNGYIGFDLYTVLPTSSQAGQLAFHGVRRRKGFLSDPLPSDYRYYEKPYQIQVTFVIPAGWSSNNGGFKVVVPITDYDFELRRIDSFGTLSGGCVGTTLYGGLDPGKFKILLQDTNNVQISNVPLLFSNLLHVPRPAASTSSTAPLAIPENFWPTPPMLYNINSAITFFIYVTNGTTLAGNATWDFTFTGVRRYPCK